MDQARDILLRYDEGKLAVEEAISALAALATRNEIPSSVAIGFICQIANDEVNKKAMGVTNGTNRTTSDSP